MAQAKLQPFYENRKTDILHYDQRLAKIVAAVTQRNPGSVLDIGCGRGTLLRRLRSKLPQARLVGVDISETTVAAVRASEFEAEVADISDGLPFAEGAFECIIFGEVIEHLVDPDAALREISRVLADSGTLILTTPNLASWFNRGLLLLGIQPVFTETSLHVNLGRRFSAFGQGRQTQGHLKVFVLPALLEMLAANGFEVESVAGATFPESNVLRPINLLMAHFPRWASNFVIVARRISSTGTRYRVMTEEGPQMIEIPLESRSPEVTGVVR